MIGVSAIAWAFPEAALTALGHVGGQSAISLAAAAFRELQGGTGFDDIDLLVYISQSAEPTRPQGAEQVLGELDYRGQPPCLDIALGCSAFPYALSLCRSLMESQSWNRAVVVTSDPLSRLTSRDDPKTSIVFAAAATATLLERDRGGAIRLGDFGADASQRLDEATVPREPLRPIGTPGARRASYVGKKAPENVARCLEINGVAAGDIDLVILHQASRAAQDVLRARLPFGARTEIPVTPRGGRNAASSTIPLTLGRIMAKRSLQGRRVLLTGVGAGMPWGSILLEF